MRHLMSGTEKGTPKNFCDKDFAELSGELSGAICLKTLVLMEVTGNPLKLFRKIFGAVRPIFWLWGSFLAPDNVKSLLRFEPQFWLEIITSRDAKSASFKGSRTPCNVIVSGNFWADFGRKTSHHVMDASCWISSTAHLLEGKRKRISREDSASKDV